MSTKDFPSVQALSGTDTDATSALKGLLDTYAEFVVDGDFRICEITDLDLSLSAVRHLQLAPGARLRVLGTGQILRSGKWMFQEPVAGPLPIKPLRSIPVHDASVYSPGEWIIVGSGTRFPTDDVNYMAVLRRVVSVDIASQSLELDMSLPSHLPMILGRKVTAYVKSDVVAQTVIPVTDSSSLAVGTFDIVEAFGRAVLKDNVSVVSVDTTPGSMSVTLSSPIDALADQYLIPNTGTYDYMPGPWIVRTQMASPLTLEMGEGSRITGQGYKSPSGVPIALKTLIMAQLAEDFRIIGPGYVGSHARGAVVLTHCVSPVIDTTIGDIWDTNLDTEGDSGSGYGVNVSGTTRGLHVAGNARFFRCRHGLTTNVGPNMNLRLLEPRAFEFPLASTPTGVYNLGAQGGPEYAIVEPAEVAYCTNHGLDTHRAGWAFTFRPGVVRDCSGGIQTRSDATVIENCLIDGVNYASAVVVAKDIVTSASIRNVRVRAIRENAGTGGIRQYGFSISSPAELIDCEVSDAMPGELVGGAIINSSLAGQQVDIVRFRASQIPRAFQFAGGRATVTDPIIDSSVAELYAESGEGLVADNQITWTHENFGAPGSALSYFTPDGTGRVANALPVDTQWVAPIMLPAGVIHSLGVEVSLPAVGATLQIALVRAKPSSGVVTDTRFAEATISAATVGVKEVTLTTPFDTGRGGNYWIAIRVDGAGVTAQSTQLNQSRNVQSLAKLTGATGFGYSRTTSAGAWSSWSGALADAPAVPRIGVGMMLL
jgi:hypothetical protein